MSYSATIYDNKAFSDKIGHWEIPSNVDFVAMKFRWPMMRRDVPEFHESYRACH